MLLPYAVLEQIKHPLCEPHLENAIPPQRVNHATFNFKSPVWLLRMIEANGTPMLHASKILKPLLPYCLGWRDYLIWDRVYHSRCSAFTSSETEGKP